MSKAGEQIKKLQAPNEKENLRRSRVYTLIEEGIQSWAFSRVYTTGSPNIFI